MPRNLNRHSPSKGLVAGSLVVFGIAASVYTIHEENGQPDLRHKPTPTHAPEALDPSQVHLPKLERSARTPLQTGAVALAHEMDVDIQVAVAAGYGTATDVEIPAMGPQGKKALLIIKAMKRPFHEVTPAHADKATIFTATLLEGTGLTGFSPGYPTETVQVETQMNPRTNELEPVAEVLEYDGADSLKISSMSHTFGGELFEQMELIGATGTEFNLNYNQQHALTTAQSMWTEMVLATQGILQPQD